jgi:hypothetical protein
LIEITLIHERAALSEELLGRGLVIAALRSSRACTQAYE